MSGSLTIERPRSPQGSSHLEQRRRRRWVRPVVCLLVLALVAGMVWLVGFSTVLAARQVEVTGVRVLSAQQVKAVAQVPLGRPLSRQDTGAIERRVETLDLVRSATVTRAWPQTIAVTVEERTPVLAVRQADGYRLVDAGGFGFLTVPAVPPGVVLTDVDVANSRLLTAVGTVAASLPGRLKGKVSVVRAQTGDGIKLLMTNGDVVYWGGPEQSPLKADVLTALLKRPARAYDVSAPQSPALR